MSKRRHGQKAFIQSRIINCLRSREGGWATVKEIIDYVYEGAITEGSRSTVMVMIMLLRRKGFPIASAQSRGYRYAPELWQPAETAQTAVAA